jgi:hypothetical protein
MLRMAAVFEEEVLKLLGILADADAKLGGVCDDAIVDVSDVHDVLEAVSAHAKPATQDVDCNEGPEIADVGEVVDRGAAVVHADGIVGEWLERFDFAGERVVEMEGHGVFCLGSVNL